MSPATWKWFGNAGHLCVGSHCRFHLCTQVGGVLISTVGEYWPESEVREIHARTRKVELVGRGDERDADFLRKFGYVEIGHGRKYETMVFRLASGECECGCGLPQVADYGEIDFAPANDAKTARDNHMKLCEAWARKDRAERQRAERQGGFDRPSAFDPHDEGRDE